MKQKEVRLPLPSAPRAGMVLDLATEDRLRFSDPRVEKDHLVISCRNVGGRRPRRGSTGHKHRFYVVRPDETTIGKPLPGVFSSGTEYFRVFHYNCT